MKLIHFHTRNEWEPYDVRQDLNVMDNLVGEQGHMARVKQMQARQAG